MKELSLHLLDIVRNSIRANASHIDILVEENIKDNILKLSISDNGNGMDKKTLDQVTNPFFTTRKVRNVGLGVPLLKAAAERCNGYFNINSTINKGTRIECGFELKHIDRAPLGNIEETIMAIISSLDNSELIYTHKYNDKEFIFDTIQVKEILDGVSLLNPDILIWIKEYIKENLYNIRKNDII